MRNLAVLAFSSLLCACAVTKPVTPREYLDEQTTATITVVAAPVIFIAASSSAIPRNPDRDLHQNTEQNQDYLEVYGVDVNRMGTHRQYIAAMKWLAPKQSTGSPILTLRVGADAIELRATTDDAKTVGILQPLAPSYSRTSKWWYFPTDTATLKRIAGAGELSATLTVDDSQTPFTLFSDGRAQLAALGAQLP